MLLLQPLFGVGQDRPGTLLWEVSKPGVPHTSYLFGTFHEVNATFFSSLPNAVEKLDQSEILYVEEKRSDAQNVAGANNLTFWTREQWEGTLNPDQEKVFASFVEKAEDPTYYTYPPLLLTSALARIYIQNFCDTLNRQSGELMDHFIEKMGHFRNKQVLSLDRSHMDILAEGAKSRDSIQNAGYAKAVIELMDKMLKDDATDCEIVQHYTSFQIDYQLDAPIKTASDAYQLHQRNDAWMVTLDQAFREHPCFVAVGYGHLRFKEGLIGQLRALGYLVKPLPVR
ncbi:TraB/GumN family protein [Salmonirosea aquatica]|uniref:TraB/GumN family protein n=1 Tax=Salmonirosea aquatica TaxID=2654236 RepID=UPI003570C6B9